MLLPLMDMAGKQTGEIEVSDAVFNGPIRPDLMHQALIRQLANARAGTHKTKTRGEVRGGGRKPWRQKGTGRARQGSTRAPQWKGGGTVFGPMPRSYAKAMPKKMRRAALRSALSSKAQAGQIVVVEDLVMDEPKTKRAAELLGNLGFDERTVLVVLAESNMAVERSFSNLPTAKTLQSGFLNIHDLLSYDTVLFSQSAIEPVVSWLDVDAAGTETMVAEAVEAETEPETSLAGEAEE